MHTVRFIDFIFLVARLDCITMSFFHLVDPRTMHLSGSPLLRDTKSESCPSPSDDTGVINNSSTGGFSVIFRPGETAINSGLNTNTTASDPDVLSTHRYSTHTASRLAGVHSRADEGRNKYERNMKMYRRIYYLFFFVRF